MEEELRLKNIERFIYMQNIAYKNNMLSIYMNTENITIIDTLSLYEICELTDTLDKYSNADIATITRELNNDISDLSKYFKRFKIHDETRQNMMYHYYDNTTIPIHCYL